jgi:hypothetical protein
LSWRREDTLDAQASADGIEVVGFVDAALVDVHGNGTAVAQDSAFETVLHTRELLVPIELGVWDQARMIIQESKEKGLALAVGIRRIGQKGAVHGIALPQVAEVAALKAAVGFGTLFGEEMGSSRATAGELAAQGARGDTGFRDGVGGVKREDADDGAAVRV